VLCSSRFTCATLYRKLGSPFPLLGRLLQRLVLLPLQRRGLHLQRGERLQGQQGSLWGRPQQRREALLQALLPLVIPLHLPNDEAYAQRSVRAQAEKQVHG